MLAVTCSHAVVDSTHLTEVIEALAKACRGETIPSVGRDMCRDALSPSRLVAKRPEFKLSFEEAAALVDQVGLTEAGLLLPVYLDISGFLSSPCHALAQIQAVNRLFCFL